MARPEDDPSDEAVRMARELGFRPKSLIKNIPAPSQQWKAPVIEWVRLLYERKFGSQHSLAPKPAATPRPSVIEFRNPDNPWPDSPDIPDLPDLVIELDDEEAEAGGVFNGYGPPGDDSGQR